MSTAPWYVLRTKPKREEAVSDVLGRRNVEFFLPMLKRAKVTRTGRRFAPLFPGYLFVHFAVPSDEYLRTRSAPGVAGLVSFDGVLAPLPGGVLQSIRERLEIENRVRYPSPFETGQRVVITQGPFKDIEAIFDERLSAAGRARVLIDLLGRQWRVQVDLANLIRAG